MRYWCPNEKSPKNSQIIYLLPIFTTRGTSDLKVMDTVESGSLICFFWHCENPIGRTVMEILTARKFWGNAEKEDQEEEYNWILQSGVHSSLIVFKLYFVYQSSR